MKKSRTKKEDLERPQRLGEEIANSISHGLGALLAIAGTVFLIIRAATLGDALAVVSVSLYGASMILLYTSSCIYHGLTSQKGKVVFQIFDHCSIFLLILGSYIPIALVAIGGWLGWLIFSVITACAVVGIVLTAIDLKRWHRLSLCLYIAMGWMGIFTIKPIYDVVGMQGLGFLILGGLFYTIGVIFYKQKTLPYMHVIWHFFVLAGSISHFFLVYNYCSYTL